MKPEIVRTNLDDLATCSVRPLRVRCERGGSRSIHRLALAEVASNLAGAEAGAPYLALAESISNLAGAEARAPYLALAEGLYD